MMNEKWRTFIGPAERWDIQAAAQFTLLVSMGLRCQHRLLDIGCGSLRAGRVFIPYLEPERYFGIEPEEWLLEDGKRLHVGAELLANRRPRFITGDRTFPADAFGVDFHYAMAQSIFTHASPSEIAQCLNRTYAALRPGGVLTATYTLGTQDSTREGWLYPGGVSYTSGFMQRAAARAGFTYTEREEKVLGLPLLWAIFRRPV